jgi:hypothetical protein
MRTRPSGSTRWPNTSASSTRPSGENIYPTVALAHKHMRTKYGGRERPHLEITGWVRIGEHGIETVGTDPRPQLQHGAATTTPGLQQVSEPSLQEEMRDEIPWK